MKDKIRYKFIPNKLLVLSTEFKWVEFLLEKVPEFIWHQIVYDNPRDWKKIPIKFQTQALAQKAIFYDLTLLPFMPFHLRTDDFYRWLLRRHPQCLGLIPEQIVTKEMAVDALKKDWRALQYFPCQWITTLLCETAVIQNGKALDYVPLNFMNAPLCYLSVLQDGKNLQYVPLEWKDKGLCKTAVKQTPDAFAYIPQDKKDLEICEIAIETKTLIV